MKVELGKPCCAPSRSAHAVPGEAGVPRVGSGVEAEAFAPVIIPGGKALLGTDMPLIPDDGEGPLRRKTLQPFRIMRTSVSNAQFAEFVEDTGYVTEAERFGWSFVFFSDVPQAMAPTKAVAGTEWWRRVDGATWRAVHGPGAEAPPDHPVVQVSWNDARAYAAWCGGRLPSEAEWEHAARGGLGDVRYPWGMEDPDDTTHLPCNIWQGRFPDENTAADGWSGTADVTAFAPNGYGLHNVVGNVWEWVEDPYRIKSLKKHVRQKLQAMKGFRVLKGGSFLCHRSYCYRYRIAARIGNSPETATSHQGFRVVWDVA